MARIEIRIPELGESSPEGVVRRWIRQPGDRVQRDEAVLELETDKANLEVAAPAAGVLAEVRVREGQTVAHGEVAGVVDTDAFAWKGPAPEPPPPALPCLRCGRPLEPANTRGWMPSGIRPLVCRACGHVELVAGDPRTF